MVKEAGNRPVLFMPYGDYEAMAQRHTGHLTDEDIFEPRTFRLEDWLRLLPRASDRIINFMMDPLNPIVLTEIWDAHLNSLEWETRVVEQVPMFAEEDPISRALRERDDAVRIDNFSQQDLRAFAKNLLLQPRRVFFRARFRPTSNEFQTHIRLMNEQGTGPEGIASMMLEGGHFTFSSINGLDQAVGYQLGHPRMPTWLEDGARVLLIPMSHETLARPTIIPLKQRPDDGKIEFYIPSSPGAAPRGSQAELVLPGALIERFHIKQIYRRIDAAIAAARAAGKTPMIVFDIDGTVANARAFTRRVFEEFLDEYRRLADKKSGPLLGDELQIEGLADNNVMTALRVLGIDDREILELAQGYLDFKRRRSDTKTYDATAALKEFVALYNSINIETAQKLRSAYDAYRREHEAFPWDSVDMVEKLKIDDPNIIALAGAHFEGKFYSSIRRLDKEPIEGIVQLIRYLQKIYPDLVSVSLTLRSAHDDNLPDGRSSSEVWFARHGIWNERSVLLRLEGNQLIDFSRSGFKKGGNEPSKSDLLNAYLLAHPELQPVLFLENDRKHTNEYLRLGYPVPVVRVDANDTPPHQPPDSNGILILSAAQLKDAIGATLEPDLVQELNQREISIGGAAWEPLMARWHAAVAAGMQPVVVLDIDDTLMMTSNRTRKIFEKFLREEWIPENPGHEWALDVIEGFTLSQIEYGIPATIKNAGLDALGPEFEKSFTKYFLQHFLSNEYLGEDLPTAGAVKFVRDLLAIGTHIIYLTGRTADDMGEGTIEALRQAGFPIDEAGVELVMRENHKESDFDFKERVLRMLARTSTIVGAADNEPQNLITVLKLSPGTVVYMVGNRHSPGAPPVPAEAIHIVDFSGRIGTPPRRTRALRGDELKQQGVEAAAIVSGLFGQISSEVKFRNRPEGQTARAGIDERILQAATAAVPILDEMASLHPLHPKAHTFGAKLSESISNLTGGRSSLDGILAEVNSRMNRSFSVQEGPRGEIRIEEADLPRSTAGSSSRRPSARHRARRPAGVRSHRLPRGLQRASRAGARAVRA